jgi:hypothetical protein
MTFCSFIHVVHSSVSISTASHKRCVHHLCLSIRSPGLGHELDIMEPDIDPAFRPKQAQVASHNEDDDESSTPCCDDDDDDDDDDPRGKQGSCAPRDDIEIDVDLNNWDDDDLSIGGGGFGDFDDAPLVRGEVPDIERPEGYGALTTEASHHVDALVQQQRQQQPHHEDAVLLDMPLAPITFDTRVLQQQHIEAHGVISERYVSLHILRIYRLS